MVGCIESRDKNSGTENITKRILLWALSGGLAAGLSACGGQSGDARFPSRQEMERLGQGSVPTRIVQSEVRDVDTWEMRDAPAAKPPSDIQHAPANAWERVLSDLARERQGLLWVSEPMACAARQFGQFYLEQGGTPGESVTRFIASRCGVPDANLGSTFLFQPLSGPASEQELARRMLPGTTEMVRKALSSGSQSAGLWFGQGKNVAVAMLTYSQRRVRLTSFPVEAGPDGKVVVRGELLMPAEKLRALVNDGSFGFRSCSIDPTARLPTFAIECQTNPNDETTMLEMAGFEAGRVMGTLVTSIVLWPKGRPSNRYSRPSYAFSLHGAADTRLPATLTAMLNQVRTEAKLAPVTLNEDESRTAARVAPHFFASMAGLESGEVADQVVLGLRAGWQIPGLVGHGQFTSALARGTSNMAPLLVSALERPSGREALLDPEARVIAIGPIVAKQEDVVAAVFGSYTLLEPSASAKDVDHVLRVLNDRRQQRKLPPASVVRELMAAAAGSARALERGERDPDGSLQDLVNKSGPVLGAGSQVWFLWADNVDDLSFPDGLLSARALRLVMGVAHYKPKGSPWAGYAVLLASTAPPSSTMAKGRVLSRAGIAF